MRHQDSALGRRHAAHNWEYADAAAREAATGFEPADVKKLALQLDDFSLWVLTDDSPVTWASASGASSAESVSYDNGASGLTGDNAQEAIDELAASIGGAPTTAVTTATGNQDDLNFSGADVLFCNNATNLVLRGLVAGVDGQALRICSKGAGAVYLNGQDTNSTAANRIIVGFFNGPAIVASGGSVDLIYDATAARWRITGIASNVPSGPQNYTELQRAADQTSTSGAAEFISFDTVISNAWGVWDAGNPSRLTIPSGQGGIWEFSVHWFANQAVTGQVQFGAKINGSTFVYSDDHYMSGATSQKVQTWKKSLAAGDYVEFYYYQASGSSKTVRVQTFSAVRSA